MTDAAPPSTHASARRLCAARTKLGTACRAWAVTGTDFCIGHAPPGSLAEAQHRAGSVLGGKLHTRERPAAPPVRVGGHDARDLESAAGLRSALAALLARVLELPVDPSVAHAAAAVAGHLAKSIDAADITARLERLESVVTRSRAVVGRI